MITHPAQDAQFQHHNMICITCGETFYARHPQTARKCPIGHENVTTISEAKQKAGVK